MTTQNIYDLADTWNAGATTFTAIKMNVTDTASAAASLLMDLQVGGSSKFRVSKTNVQVPSVVNSTLASVSAIGSTNSGFYTTDGVDWGYTRAGAAMWQSGFEYFRLTANANFGWGASVTSANDTILTRRAAANLRFGAADAAAPVAQTLSVQSVVAGTTNTAGANLTITGSQGTGNAAGGSIIFQVAPAGSSGSAQNALVNALTIDSTKLATFAAGITAGGPITYTSLFYAGGSYAGLYTSSFLGWSNGNADATTANYDVRLFRDAANTLALRNGANGQTQNIYGTYTDGSNYRRVAIAMTTAGVATLKPEGAGTGASGNVLHISGLPTSNPGPGILWNNGGTVSVGT